MSNIMQSPSPEYNALSIPGDAQVPGSRRPPRKFSRRVRIALGVLALVVGAGMMVLALSVGTAVTTSSGPTIASDQYYSALKNQDYTRAYFSLGSRLKTVFSQETFAHLAQQRDANAGKVTHYAYTNVPSGNPATVNLTVIRANGTTYPVILEMRPEENTWKVTAFDRI